MLSTPYITSFVLQQVYVINTVHYVIRFTIGVCYKHRTLRHSFYNRCMLSTTLPYITSFVLQQVYVIQHSVINTVHYVIRFTIGVCYKHRTLRHSFYNRCMLSTPYITSFVLQQVYVIKPYITSFVLQQVYVINTVHYVIRFTIGVCYQHRTLRHSFYNRCMLSTPYITSFVLQQVYVINTVHYVIRFTIGVCYKHRTLRHSFYNRCMLSTPYITSFVLQQVYVINTVHYVIRFTIGVCYQHRTLRHSFYNRCML